MQPITTRRAEAKMMTNDIRTMTLKKRNASRSLSHTNAEPLVGRSRSSSACPASATKLEGSRCSLRETPGTTSERSLPSTSPLLIYYGSLRDLFAKCPFSILMASLLSGVLSIFMILEQVARSQNVCGL
jgi:hypothetical protein